MGSQAMGAELEDAAASERAAARVRAFRLVREVQDGLALSAGAVEQLVAEADERGWPEVACAVLYLDVVRSKQDGWHYQEQTLARLLERAEAEGDPAMVAMALAGRSRVLRSSGDTNTSVAAERELARATVLLEGADGGAALERAAAHVECAIAYAGSGLWELEVEHYRQAELLIRLEPEDPGLAPAVLYNRAELHLNWAAALRELGDVEALQQQARRAAEALHAAEVPDMPDAWRAELHVFATLLKAIAPGVTVPAFAGVRSREWHVYQGYLRLAAALWADDAAAGLRHAHAAVGSIDRALSAEVHDLARCVAAEIEATILGRETDGLAYARHLVRLRWQARLSALGAMQAHLHAERLRAEHAVLNDHAHLDELTGLGNRRALQRYLKGLTRDGTGDIATLLLDVDRFKSINDTHGHGVGDQALIRVAALLQSSVRQGDLAVRLGGDEFLVVLSDVPPHAARARAHAIRAAIAAEPWQHIADGLAVRASVGFACGGPERHEKLVAVADAALYRAKATGGDRVSEGHDDGGTIGARG